MTKKVDVDAILHAYQVEGKSLEAIGAQFGISDGTVRNRLRKLGIARRDVGGTRRRIDRVRLRELRTAGLALSDLSFIFGVTNSAIQRSLAQLGLTGAA